jgi:hypothetical protein
MALALVIVIGVLVIVSASLGIVFTLISRLARKRAAEVAAMFPPSDILHQDSNVSFFGQASAGVMQVRGNGVLVLTKNELYFKMWVTSKELRIPLRSITGMETPTWFLGKSRFTPLLQVNFQNDMGQSDSAAWQVRDLAAWKQRIEQTTRT